MLVLADHREGDTEFSESTSGTRLKAETQPSVPQRRLRVLTQRTPENTKALPFTSHGLFCAITVQAGSRRDVSHRQGMALPRRDSF